MNIRVNPTAPIALPTRKLAVAPMMKWTDRFYRYFARLITKNTWLYTEMVTTGAILHGDRYRFLRFDETEHPIALQLGGSEPESLAACAKFAEQWGYDEVNLNVGCPSERVQSGAFGACLMAEPMLVAECLKAMQDQVSIPVTVKHRTGIDHIEEYDYLRDFVGTVHHYSGCMVFIVHARNAVLKGLSPKENREIPPLKYDYVHRLKKDFPNLEIIINGGITRYEDTALQLQHLDGVMIGREAYHNPYGVLAEADHRFHGDDRPIPSRIDVMRAMMPFIERELTENVPLSLICRHILGLYQGLPGARRWRRHLSDESVLRHGDIAVIEQALERVEAAIRGAD